MVAPNLQHGEVVRSLTVKVYQDNALSVEGDGIQDPLWAIAALENAIDALRNQLRPKFQVIVPGKDVSLK